VVPVGVGFSHPGGETPPQQGRNPRKARSRCRGEFHIRLYNGKRPKKNTKSPRKSFKNRNTLQNTIYQDIIECYAEHNESMEDDDGSSA